MRKILSIAIVSSCLFGFKIPIYSAYLGKASAQEAKYDMTTIYKTYKSFYIEFGEFPYSIQDMIDRYNLYLSSEGWEFEIQIDINHQIDINVETFNFEGYIVAYSNEEMPDGAGEIILLDVKTLQFCGYAQKFDCRLD